MIWLMHILIFMMTAKGSKYTILNTLHRSNVFHVILGYGMGTNNTTQISIFTYRFNAYQSSTEWMGRSTNSENRLLGKPNATRSFGRHKSWKWKNVNQGGKECNRGKEFIWLEVSTMEYFGNSNELSDFIKTDNLTLYVPCIILQSVDKPTRCNTSYEWSLFCIIWLYLFWTITSPSSGASFHKLYNALVRSCRPV